MSEYQYYEFVAVDRPLTPQQVAAVRQVSTRADITSTRFVNEYQWGNFKGNVDQFLRDYFDCHVHVTNWGTRRFAFKLPKALLDRSAVEAYFHDASLDVRPVGDALVVDINPDFEDGGEWDETDPHGVMGSLVNLRAEVLAGDLRPLYLGWLAGVEYGGTEGEVDNDDEPAPPVPAGMGSLSAAQRALADFVALPDELIAAAAADGPPPARPPDLAAAVRAASVDQKEQWLLDVLRGDDPLAVARVRRQLTGGTTAARPVATGRTVGQLRRAWAERETRADRERTAAAAAARRRHEAAEAAARQRRLDELAARGDKAWQDVDLFVAQRTGSAYGQAVAMLLDLRTLADGPGGNPAAFAERCRALLKANTRRSSLIAAARSAGLYPA